MISRRDFIGRVGGAALLAGAWPGRVFADEAKGENGDFDFIAVNDLHFTDPKLCPPWFEKVFSAMRASAPNAEFLVVSGDLSSVAARQEFEGLKEVFPRLKIPVRIVPGNHDVTAAGDRSLYESIFPGKLNYVVEHRGWQFFHLDSVENRSFQGTRIPKETLAWLAAEIRKHDPAKPTVISTHFPLGFSHARRPKNADDLLAPFRAFNVRHVFSGHWHGYTEMEIRGATATTNRCCARLRENHDQSPLKGWWVCEARQGRIHRRFVSVPV